MVGQISKPNKGLKRSEDEVGPLLTTKKLMEAQANDVLCQNRKEVLRKDETLTVNKNGLR